MALNAGRLDREIVLLTATTEQASSGAEVTTWPDVATVEDAAGVDNALVLWAEWLSPKAAERWLPQQRLESYVDGAFRMYDQSPRPTPGGTRILFDGTIYDVTGVVEIGRGEGLLVTVTARGV